MLAGIRTSTVMIIGFAVLGALIGAGGYGQPILNGVRLLDERLIMEGAIPAAVMAIMAQWLLGVVERHAVSRGLRIHARS
jgi:osmoprotectant transport system permease protein